MRRCQFCSRSGKYPGGFFYGNPSCRLETGEGLGGLRGNYPGFWLPITAQWGVTRADWWQLIIRARPVTCTSTGRKEEGRKQEDPPVKTVKLGWSDRSLSTCCQISQSLNLQEKWKQAQISTCSSPASGLTRVSLVLNCLKNKQFHCKNLQEVNCQTYQLFDFPSDSKEEGTTHWVFPCNCRELYWNFKLNCQPVTGPAGKTVVILTGLTGPSSPSNPAGQNYATLFVWEVEIF